MWFRRHSNCDEEARTAREERHQAEKQLAQTIARRPEVEQLTARLEELRELNNFGHKIEIAMARKRSL